MGTVREVFLTLRAKFDQLRTVNWKEAFHGKLFKSVHRMYGDHRISVYQAGDSCPNQYCTFDPTDWWIDGFYETARADYNIDVTYDEATKTYHLKDVRVEGHLSRETQDFKGVALGAGAKHGAFHLKDVVDWVANQVPKGERWRLFFFACDVVEPGMAADMDEVTEEDLKTALGVKTPPRLSMDVETAGSVSLLHNAPPT